LTENLNPNPTPLIEWDKKQKRAFQNLTTGFKIGNKQNEKIRFLTLTTSEIQAKNQEYDINNLNENIRRLKQRIKRLTVAKLIISGYLKTEDIRKYYPNIKLGKKFKYEYFRIRTNEGNGVAHIVYKGEFLPYVWLVDNWLDLHNSWNIDIRLIKKDFKKQSRYIVSQYLSNQETSYIRSSQSWGWIIRAYCKEWANFLVLMHTKYFYNGVKQRFYKPNKRYKYGESGLTDPPTKGLQVDIFKEWYNYLLRLLRIQARLKQERLQFA
jgi:hypothetical protein